MKLLAIMDPIEAIQLKKDSSLALLLEAQQRNWEISYIQPKDLFANGSHIYALSQQISVQKIQPWALFKGETQIRALTDFDIILLRKDPPFDRHYLFATYLLEIAAQQGCYIVNNPKSVRDANEKLFCLWFEQCCPQLLVSAKINQIKDFLAQHKKIVVKPLHAMAGDSIFVLQENDININVTLEMLTQHETMLIMVQRFIPEISKGDKRILMIKGKPYPYAISRIPAPGDFRGNLAKGAKGQGTTLSERDIFLCSQIGPVLNEKGLYFVGLDVIGDYVTEINVTSPTGIREIENAFNLNVASDILDTLTHHLSPKA